MKPQIEHPMLARNNRSQETLTPSLPEIPVHTVMSPDDEVAFKQQMAQAEVAFGKVLAPDAKVDSILDREMNKHEVFSKLVLLKEDRTTEISVAGLKFRMRLLNSIDNAFIMKEVRKEPAEDQLTSLTLLVLAAAIVDISGVRLEDRFSGPGTIADPTLRKYYEIRQWHRPLVNTLQKAYGDFQTSVEKEYTGDFLAK